MDMDELKQRFQAMFNQPAAGAVRAPGRVNLIGEHTDYNDGFVLPIAIEREVRALYAPRKDSTVRLVSLQMPQEAVFDLSAVAAGEPAWANYSRGVAAGLIASGITGPGVDIMLDSTVPLGGGLSSSAALEVATAMALMAAWGRFGAVAGGELARLCQKAEHEFAGAPCGIMDQSISVLGQPGNALLLDCRSGQTQQIPFNDPKLVLLVADTQVKHVISDGGYAARRRQCESAARTLGVPALRDLDEDTFQLAVCQAALDGVELMRSRHVVGEIARTLEAVEALQVGDYIHFGELMYGSHASLRDDYQVSCEELDLIVDAARACRGVYGARMTGGGFGGCAIILAEIRQAQAVTSAVQTAFASRFGKVCPIFTTRAAAGAGKIW